MSNKKCHMINGQYLKSLVLGKYSHQNRECGNRLCDGTDAEDINLRCSTWKPQKQYTGVVAYSYILYV